MANICDDEQTVSGWNVLGSAIIGEKPGDQTGYSVSLSSNGSIVAVGSPFNDVNGKTSGNVKVYQYIDASKTWKQLGDTIKGKASGDMSGWSVSLSSNGKIVAIGAPYNDGSSIDNNDNRGHIRVYEYEDASETWIQLGDDIDGEAMGDLSGWSVSLSSNGKIVAIGASYNDGSNIDFLNNRGHVRVYQYEEPLGKGSWIQLGDDIDGKAINDRLGKSLSLSSDGKIVAIGAFGANNRGHVRVYQYEESLGKGSWIQLGDDIDGKAMGDLSGWSLSLSSNGKIVAIGAPYNDKNVNNDDNQGHVRVYQYEESLGKGSWIQLGEDIEGEAMSDMLGSSVSLSNDGTIVAVGAPLNDGMIVNPNDINDNEGRVIVYQYKEVLGTGSWSRLESYIDGRAKDDRLGQSLSLSSDGTIVAIGAPHNNAGYVIVYKLILPEIDIKLVEDKIPTCKIPDDHISRRVRGCGERVNDIPRQERRSTRNAYRIYAYSRYRRF